MGTASYYTDVGLCSFVPRRRIAAAAAMLGLLMWTAGLQVARGSCRVCQQAGRPDAVGQGLSLQPGRVPHHDAGSIRRHGCVYLKSGRRAGHVKPAARALAFVEPGGRYSVGIVSLVWYNAGAW